MAYSEKVVDHFNNPRNMGSFKKDEPGVGTGIVGAPECGDVMKLQIKVQDDKIVDAKFKTSAAALRSPAPASLQNG
jgi:nitrogen fixation NifU-like protein